MQWILTDPARFLTEQAELAGLAAEGWATLAWNISDGLVNVDLDLTVHGKTFAARLTYPAHFPATPPYIRPRDPLQRWSGHQYGAGGPLCLEWRSDNWQPAVTGADMVRSAFRLLSEENHPEAPREVPSAHRVTIGQELRSRRSRLIVTPSLLASLRQLPLNAHMRLQTVCLAHSRATTYFVRQIGLVDALVPVEDLPKGLADYFPLFAWRGDGVVFRSPSFTEALEATTLNDLVSAIEYAGLDVSYFSVADSATGKLPTPFVLLTGDDGSISHAFVVECGEPRTIQRCAVLGANMGGRRVTDEADQLGALKFGIVGLGSVGSKMAISLARAGARKFLLVDDDLLLPENVVRHELNWASVGVHKVYAVADALHLISSSLEIDPRTHRLAGQESAAASASLLTELSKCDLILDATASSEVFLLLASVARSSKIPLVWCEVFAGGYGGLIARARPDLDPHPIAVRDALHSYLSTLPEAPFKHAVDYEDTGEVSLIGLDSDVACVASAATRLAIDTGLRRNPSEFPYAVYLLGLRKEWIFEQPFDTRPVAVTGPGWDSDAGDAYPETLKQAIQSALSMFKPPENADHSTDS